MKLNVSRVDVWVAGIEDRPGGLAKKLAALAEAGANLEFVIARRSLEQPGKGVVFVTPVKGAAQSKAATNGGFHRSESLHSVRVEGPDKPGLGAKLTQQLAAAGVNLRGLSAGVIGKRFVLYLAFDTSDDAAKAMRLAKRLS
jgi:hypothetical protein